MEHTPTIGELETQVAELRRQLAFYLRKTEKTDGYIQWLEDSLKRYRSILGSISDYVYTVTIKNGEPIDTFHENGCLFMTGYHPDDFKRMPMLWIDMVYEEDRDAVKQYADDVMSGKHVQPLEHRIICKNGTEKWVENTIVPHYDQTNKLTAYHGIVRDITPSRKADAALEENRERLGELVEQRTAELSQTISQLHIEMAERKNAEEQIKHMAMHDPLTDLPNRNLLFDRIDHALLIADRNGSLAAVFFIDLDGFKRINDLFGHEVGDNVLSILAHRLTGALRKSDTMARIGGDEFVALIENLRGIHAAEEIADKIIMLLRQPVEVDGHKLTIGASIGISIYPYDGSNVFQILRRADSAMYRVKKHGKNGYALYNTLITKTRERSYAKIEMANDLPPENESNNKLESGI